MNPGIKKVRAPAGGPVGEEFCLEAPSRLVFLEGPTESEGGVQVWSVGYPPPRSTFWKATWQDAIKSLRYGHSC